MPKVSVIIPVYNAEKYLRQCLDSVVGQTLRDIEIICVDDGSADGSLDILREYAQKDSRVKVLCQQNQYAGVARNNGMAAASGEYYVFLDADDFFEPDLLELQYERCKNCSADISLCGADRFDQREQAFLETSWFLPKRYIRNEPFNWKDWKEHIFQVTSLAPWNKMFSANFIKKHGLKFQALPRANDVYFSMMALVLAENITIVGKVLVHYRVGMSANLQSQNSQSPLTFCDALEAVRESLKENGIFEDVWVSFANNALSQVVYNLKKLEGSDGYQNLIDALQERYLQMFEIKRGIEKGLLDKQFSKELMTRMEVSRFPSVKREAMLPPAGEIAVSVIIPVYNVEKYLRQCLDSVLQQTLREIEIICVDDGSNDGSPSILREYQAKDERVRIVSQENQGLSSARNIAMKKARGEFIYYIDSDDYLETDALEELYSLSTGNSLDAVFFDLVSFYDGTGKIRPSAIHRKEYARVYDGVSFMRMLKDDHAYITSACLMMTRREFLLKNGISFYEGIIHEDELFCFQVLMCADRVSYINHKYYHRRVRENSIMTTAKSTKNVIGYFTCMQEMLKYGLENARNDEKGTEILRAFQAMRYAVRQTYGKLSVDEQAEMAFDNPCSAMLFETFILNEGKAAGAVQPATLPVCEQQSRQAERILRLRVNMLEGEIRAIHSSATYKVGRFITWLPRKLRGCIRCYQEHGIHFTVQRILVHLGLREDPFNPVRKKVSVAEKAVGEVGVEKRKEEVGSSYEERLSAWYKKRCGHFLDLAEPRTFNEKLQWLKLYDSVPLKTLLADKYLFRGWVEQELGKQYLIPLEGVWDSFDEIDFEKLPQQFVLMANHGSSWNIIVKDKAALERDDAKQKFDRWLGTNFALQYGLEMHYMNIPPKIIAEEYHPCQYEYQFWCFNGEPKFISAIHAPHGENAKATYDLEWKKLEFITSLPELKVKLEKPSRFEEMVNITKKICQQFSFVRIDFLHDGQKIFVGEITFTPASGLCQWQPQEYDQILGDWLTLPPKSPIPERKF